MRKAELVIPADRTCLRPLTAFCREAARAAGFAPARVERLTLALEEVTLNIIAHAFPAGNGYSFALEIEMGKEALSITFMENGSPFSPELFQHCGESETPKDTDTELSFNLIKSSVDKAVFSRQGSAGMRICLTLLGPGNPPSENAVPAEEPPLFSIRLTSMEDALSAAECAYDSRDCIREDFLCDPKAFYEELRKGRLVSAIAVEKDGHVLGHAAFRLPENEAAAEICADFVRPRLRSSRIMLKLLAFLIMKARERKLAGLTLTADLDKPGPHETALKLGFVYCAVFLGGNAAKLFLGLTDAPACVIYPPEKGGKEIMRALEVCGCKAVAYEGEQPAISAGAGELRSAPAPSADSAVMEIRAIGKNTGSELAAALRNAKKEKKTGVCIRINLQDPACPLLCAELGKSGFFYAGILPRHLAGKHCLLLQNGTSGKSDPVKPTLPEEQGAELLAHVLRAERETAG